MSLQIPRHHDHRWLKKTINNISLACINMLHDRITALSHWAVSPFFNHYTAGKLLNSYFRTPALAYEDLLILTGELTKNIREVEKMFRPAVFNVLAHNRDDHAKNFSFLMDEKGDGNYHQLMI
ncbi:HipA domain-containing protein [Dyadobacter psychrotolerans]|uniref:HipA domain-containing protein n=1 Tax=Dyadobacter psychrotolerans TaxID=2541721 RepID=UPI001E3CB71A|nr:HipA domain-containing protein [Dyadobacter psychrotolerans]